jgi:hypothetical protein
MSKKGYVPNRKYHKLSNVDEGSLTADCCLCGPVSGLAVHQPGFYGCPNSHWGSRNLQRKNNGEAMKKTWHTLDLIDENNAMAVCQLCGPVTIGRKKGKWVCGTVHALHLLHSRESARKRKGTLDQPERITKNYRKHIKNVCEDCGFTHELSAMFDIHHIDEDQNNNHPSNLKTVCPRCHRLYHRQ